MRTATRLLFIALTGLALVLVGCGGDGGEEAETTGEADDYEDGVYAFPHLTVKIRVRPGPGGTTQVVGRS